MNRIPIVCIVGKSDSGKTTFIEKLVPELKRRGYRVATIKHDVHGFNIDIPGKDSWRHSRAGADVTVVSSSKKIAVIKKVVGELTLDEIAERYLSDVDIIIAEGFKRQDKPKIEVHRPDVHVSPLCSSRELIALVGLPVRQVGKPTSRQGETSILDVPHFDREDAEGVADIIEERFLGKKRR
ncbi:MAG: molybdopterin-guanine dinucleotide biosynthesis protein B [Actinomycetota bacterium]|nr:molybdopterin-guanine dinucleotide biosynthesis protein B [Actinomycetota bacterium]